jgi:hypothetical protein
MAPLVQGHLPAWDKGSIVTTRRVSSCLYTVLSLGLVQAYWDMVTVFLEEVGIAVASLFSIPLQPPPRQRQCGKGYTGPSWRQLHPDLGGGTEEEGIHA